MDFKDLVQHRRSIRSFTSQPVSEADCKALLRAALMSPTGKNSRAWQFLVVTEPTQLQALAKCKPQSGDFIAEAPLSIVVLGNPSVTDTWVEDASIAAITIQYQAAELGLGSCWCQIRGREGAESAVRQLLNIPAHLAVLCVIAVGHPAIPRKPQNEEALKWSQVIGL